MIDAIDVSSIHTSDLSASANTTMPRDESFKKSDPPCLHLDNSLSSVLSVITINSHGHIPLDDGDNSAAFRIKSIFSSSISMLLYFLMLLLVIRRSNI